MRHEELNKAELAERFGVDVRTITNWVQEGMPQRRKSGKPSYSWPECREWREGDIRKDARADRHAGGDDDKKTRLAELRLRQLEIEVEQADLDLAERRGELIPVAFMISEFDRIAQGLRKALLSFPATWAERLGSCPSTPERQRMLSDGINDMMPLLDDMTEEGDEDDAPAGVPEQGQAETAPANDGPAPPAQEAAS